MRSLKNDFKFAITNFRSIGSMSDDQRCSTSTVDISNGLTVQCKLVSFIQTMRLTRLIIMGTMTRRTDSPKTATRQDQGTSGYLCLNLETAISVLPMLYSVVCRLLGWHLHG